MWVDYKKTPNLISAQMWKDLLEGEGLPTMILPEGDILDWAEDAEGSGTRCRRNFEKALAGTL